MNEHAKKATEWLKKNSKSHSNSCSKEYGNKLTTTKYLDESGNYIGRIQKTNNEICFVCVEASNYASNIIGCVFCPPKIG